MENTWNNGPQYTSHHELFYMKTCVQDRYYSQALLSFPSPFPIPLLKNACKGHFQPKETGHNSNHQPGIFSVPESVLGKVS